MCKHTPEMELVHVVCIIDSVRAAFQHNKVSSKGATPFSSAELPHWESLLNQIKHFQ